MSKTVLVIANNSDGLYGFRREMLAALSEKGAVFASVPDNGYFPELRELGVEIIETEMDRRGINPMTDLKLMRQYFKILRSVKPDLVITYTIKPNIYGGFACRLRKIPYAVNITGLGTAFQSDGLLRRLVTWMYRVALKRAKVVFFENAGNQQTLLDEKIVSQEQCCLLPGAGVNLERYADTPYPEDDGPVRFLFMGRVMREKGVDELFAAMDRMRREGIACTLDMLGYYEEDYAETMARYEAAGWLHNHGYQADVRPFIEKAHCFVLPSWHEGMANTNLECAAMGRPVITSDIPGCREAVLEGKSGLLCQARNADSLYEAMKRFCSMPPQEREAMGKAGRGHMENVFDKKKVVAETIKNLFDGWNMNV